jgi:hypothetical protein
LNPSFDHQFFVSEGHGCALCFQSTPCSREAFKSSS